jgi:hypothetical protein
MYVYLNFQMGWVATGVKTEALMDGWLSGYIKGWMAKAGRIEGWVAKVSGIEGWVAKLV